jgi:hypothetical protein
MSRGCDAENRRWLLALLLAHPPSPYYGPSKKGAWALTLLSLTATTCVHTVLGSESVSVQPVAEPRLLCNQAWICIELRILIFAVSDSHYERVWFRVQTSG